MHDSSLREMARLLREYGPSDTNVSVADIGSYDSCGTYKPLIEKYGWSYTGIDIAAGPNVDIVVNERDWSIVKSKFDIVISGQCMEHVRAIWDWILQVKSICKPNGLIILIAPWQWRIHQHPVDCWRILPDGMSYLLAQHAGLQVLEVGHNETDCYGVARNA